MCLQGTILVDFNDEYNYHDSLEACLIEGTVAMSSCKILALNRAHGPFHLFTVSNGSVNIYENRSYASILTGSHAKIKLVTKKKKEKERKKKSSLKGLSGLVSFCFVLFVCLFVCWKVGWFGFWVFR